MHRSRIAVVLIDQAAETYETAAQFWAAATGSSRAAEPPTAESPYESLRPLPGGVDLALQRTGAGSPARVHLDIETDDVDAEIARLLALGARIAERRDGYAILTDPGGLVFCVVPVQSAREDFEVHATTWS